MDGRKGIRAGYKKLGPVNKLLFWIAIIGILLTILIYYVQESSSQKNEIEARVDRAEKHYREMKELFNINSKIEKKGRPYIRITEFRIKRDDSRSMPMDYITLEMENNGDIQANNILVTTEIRDTSWEEFRIKNNITKTVFKGTLGRNLALVPQGSVKIEEEGIGSFLIANEDMYFKWQNEILNKRVTYKKENGKFPTEDILSLWVEISYSGDKEQATKPYLTKVLFSHEYKENNGKLESVWIPMYEKIK